MRQAADFYDQVAAEYDRRWAYGARDTARQTAWLARECRPGRLLDLGCGTGRMLEPLARAGFTPVGLDHSPAMLARARHRLPQARLVMADAGQGLPFRDSSFETIISLHATLSHLAEADQRYRLAAEALRVLRPGGVMVVELPHPASFPPDKPAGRWRTFRPGISCRRCGPCLEELRLDLRGDLSTLIHVFDHEGLKVWLRGFAKVHLYPGFVPGRYSPRRGQVMVVCAYKE